MRAIDINACDWLSEAGCERHQLVRVYQTFMGLSKLVLFLLEVVLGTATGVAITR
jgi:cell division protein FtsL